MFRKLIERVTGRRRSGWPLRTTHPRPDLTCAETGPWRPWEEPPMFPVDASPQERARVLAEWGRRVGPRGSVGLVESDLDLRGLTWDEAVALVHARGVARLADARP